MKDVELGLFNGSFDVTKIPVHVVALSTESSQDTVPSTTQLPPPPPCGACGCNGFEEERLRNADVTMLLLLCVDRSCKEEGKENVSEC